MHAGFNKLSQIDHISRSLNASFEKSLRQISRLYLHGQGPQAKCCTGAPKSLATALQERSLIIRVFCLTWLPPLTLSINLSFFSIVFNPKLVWSRWSWFLWIGSCFISHLALRQSQSQAGSNIWREEDKWPGPTFQLLKKGSLWLFCNFSSRRACQ